MLSSSTPTPFAHHNASGYDTTESDRCSTSLSPEHNIIDWDHALGELARTITSANESQVSHEAFCFHTRYSIATRRVDAIRVKHFIVARLLTYNIP